MNRSVICPACQRPMELTDSRQMPTHDFQSGLRVLCRASGWCVPDVPTRQLGRAWRQYLGTDVR